MIALPASCAPWESSASVRAAPRPVRSCGGCTLCCEVLPFYEVERDWDAGCKHCEPGVGCTVYPDRAKLVHKICETYTCAWRLGAGAPRSCVARGSGASRSKPRGARPDLR